MYKSHCQHDRQFRCEEQNVIHVEDTEDASGWEESFFGVNLRES